MKVLLQAKHVFAETGGNATYASRLFEGLAEASSGVEVAPFGTPRGGRGRAAKLDDVFDAIEPWRVAADALLHFTGDTGALVRGRRRRPRIVTTVHGIASAHVDGIRSPAVEALWRARVRRAIAVSDLVVTPSRSSARDLVDHLGATAQVVHAIHSGIDHDRFNPERAAEGLPPDLAQRIGDRPYLLYVGNLEPRKNVERAIEAFLASRLPAAGWRFVIAGKAAWRFGPILEAIDRAGPPVEYLGRVTDDALVPLLGGAHGFFFPSLYEGFGFPPIEAMACGTPVVCSRGGSLDEVVADAAITADPLDVTDLAAGLDQLLDDRTRADLAAAGLVNAQRFSWPASVAAHVEHYCSLG